MKKVILIFFIIVQLINANSLSEVTSTIHSHEHTHIQADTHAHEHQHLESNSLTFFYQTNNKVLTYDLAKVSFLNFYKQKPQSIPPSIFRPPIS